MSDQPSTSETVKPALRRVRDPSALTSEYHKAHKQLLLWSGILFIWELIGVDLEKAKGVGGNVGAAVSILKSPQAVPWALLLLVLYFLMKCGIEWFQSNQERRKVRAARLDFGTAVAVALAAIGLYLYQTLSQVQFANTAGGGASKKVSVFVGFIIPIALGGLIQGLSGEKPAAFISDWITAIFGRTKSGNRRVSPTFVVLWIAWTLSAIIIFVIGRRGREPNWPWCYVGIGTQIGLAYLMDRVFPIIQARAEAARDKLTASDDSQPAAGGTVADSDD